MKTKITSTSHNSLLSQFLYYYFIQMYNFFFFFQLHYKIKKKNKCHDFSEFREMFNGDTEL